MRVLFVSLAIVIIDQITKLLAKGFSIPFFNLSFDGMIPGKRNNFLGDFFNLTLIENPGIAFGIDFGIKYKLLLSLFTIAATAGLIIYLYVNRDKNKSFRLAFAVIIGGAAGNLIDRVFYGVLFDYAPLFYGKVVDFFELNLFSFFLFNKTLGNYIFNVADIAVTSGVIWLLIASRKTESDKEIITIDEKLAIEENE